MTQVPYSPTPEITQQQIAQPSVHVDTPLAAFGGASAEAMQGLGKTVEGAGNEIFARAVALKQLDNESEAREADTNYMMQVGKLHADFSTLEGKARADALPAYMQDIQELRQKMRGGLSNPMAQRMFDASSLSTMGRTIFNGAGQAASGARDFTVKTLNSQGIVDAKQAEDDPSPATIDDKLRRAEDRGRQVAALAGAPPGSAIEQRTVLEEQSKIVRSQAIGISKKDPELASKVLEANKTKMTQDDYNSTYDRVTSAARDLGSKTISQSIWGDMGVAKDGKAASSLADMEEEGKKRAEALRPDDPVFQNQVRREVQTLYTANRFAEWQQEAQVKSDLDNFIVKQMPFSLEDFKSKPGGQALYDSMTPKQQKSLPHDILQYHRQQGQISDEDRYGELKGMFLDPASRDKAMDVDLFSEKLNPDHRNVLMKMRQAILKDGVADPHVSRYYGYMKNQYGAELSALNALSSSKDPQEFYKLQGAISDTLQAWQETKGHLPTPQEFQEKIAPMLMKDVSSPRLGGWLGTSTSKAFETVVPDNKHEQIVVEYKRKNGEEPNEAQIQHYYNLMTFKELFERQKTQDRYGK